MALSIDVLVGTHGNERFGLLLDEMLGKKPAYGVRHRVAHPEAVAKDVRHLGPGYQLQAHYPGDPNGDPEDRAAYETMEWFGDHAGSTETLIYDVHDFETPSLMNFMVIGRRALKAAIVGAYLLGYKDCAIIDDPFKRAVPNAVLLENSFAKNDIYSDYLGAAGILFQKLRNISCQGNIPEYIQHYDAIARSLRFYTLHEIPSTDSNGKLRPVIPSLEAVSSKGALTGLALSAEQRKELHIPNNGIPVCAETWNHHNMSKIVPELGRTAMGIPRREWFGGYFLPTEPPVSDGEWVVSEDIAA